MKSISERYPLSACCGPAVLLLVIALPHPACARQQSREAQLAVVSELEAAGEYDRALQILQPLSRNDPDDYELLCWMAEIQLGRSGIIREAVSPQDAKPLCQEAVRYARRAVEVAPDSAGGWFQVGQTTGMLSQLPGGRETIEMAAESTAGSRIREAIRAALVPWALGHYDPLEEET